MARSLDEQPFNNRIELFFQIAIFYSLATYFIELEFIRSENSIVGPKFFLWSERAVASVFTIEYVSRWIRSRKWHYPFTFAALIDLFAVLPFYVGFLVDLRVLRLIRTLRMLRLFKLQRYNTALHSFMHSIRSVVDQLSALGIVVLFFVMLSSTVMYECEHTAQPHTFARFSDAVWWCVSALTTVGFVDKFPITTAGRITATFSVLFGLGVFGTFISVIGGSFIQGKGDMTTIRISRLCRDRLASLVLDKGKDVNASNLASVVEGLVGDTISGDQPAGQEFER